MENNSGLVMIKDLLGNKEGLTNSLGLIKKLLEKPEEIIRGQVGFNVNVDSVLEELARKPVNTEEEAALGMKLHKASLINRNQGSIDEKIKNTIDLINASPKGIKTQYSCSSHPRYYFNLPMSFTKEEENLFCDDLGVGSDSVTNEYMLAYPHEFYIRCIVPNVELAGLMTRVIEECPSTKPAEELFKMPYTKYADVVTERAQGNGGSLLNFMYIGQNTLDYLDYLNVRVSPYDKNSSIVSVSSDLITPVLFKLEDAESVYWELINRLELKTLKVLGVV